MNPGVTGAIEKRMTLRDFSVPPHAIGAAHT